MVPLLPQELLDLIIDAVYASNGTAPLKTLSTVSRAWRPRSQSNIFRKLVLDWAAMESIHSDITSTTDIPNDAAETTQNVSRQRLPTVFSYVRKLHIVAFQVTCPENDGTYLEVLRLFHNVTSLRILDWDFRRFDAHHIFHFLNHFGATVRTLKLHECHADSEVLIFLTSMFPLVDHLEVDSRYPCTAVNYEIQRSDRPPKGVEFRGNLIFRFLSAQHEQFLSFVNEHSSGVHSISAELCVNKGELQRLFECRGGSLSAVGVHSIWGQDLVSLSSCTQIRTASIHLLGDFKRDDPNWDALSTLTSPNLEEIKICSFDSPMTSKPLEGWEDIDDLLCQHYDRSYRNGVRNFRVSLNPTEMDSKEECNQLLEGARMAWPRFVKKGTVVLSAES